MKKSGFLNTVEKKYIVGYGIVGVFSVLFMLVAIVCNTYVSNHYKNAIEELLSVNHLERAVDDLNSSVNLTYLFLTETGVEDYALERVQVEQYLQEIDSQMEKKFSREVMDACETVRSYVVESDALMEKMKVYFSESRYKSVENAEDTYNGLQEIYSFVALRFQNAYSEKLNTLSRLENQLNRLQSNAILVQVGILIAASLCSMIYLVKVISSVSRSIATMHRGVESIQENVFEAQAIQIESNDEFEGFARAFNHMIEIIQKQMRELEENADIKEQLAEMEIKNLRMFSELQKSHLDFLQSRINPHFLFNTLNMISSLARIENADKCAELMEITAAFLRYNLDNITKTVTLEKEVKNLKDYVAIQECRYGGRYGYCFEVDERCLDFSMPCMILQPLVENSIQHGIAMMWEGGMVWIRVYPSKDRICLEISDNGAGMTEEQIKAIYEDLQRNKSSSSHIGIRNIYRRLRLFYHDDVLFELRNMDPGLKILISLPGQEVQKDETDNGNCG
ncbi:MAG: histidine kinase [Lachnospiraceae bacterium]|nr:histidine kinase [Lachnospiraceae bacterium]